MSKKRKSAIESTFFTILSTPNSTHNSSPEIMKQWGNMNAANINTILSHSSGIVNWKDQDLKFLGCSNNVAKLLGMNSPDCIIGKSDKDLVWSKNGYDKVFEEEDHEVLSGVTKFILGRYTFYEQEKVMLVKKIPIINDKNRVTGIFNFLNEIPDWNLSSMVTMLTNLGIEITPTLINNIENFIIQEKPGYKELGLTKREEQCLYYLLKGMTAKEIARVLGLSFRTVEIYMSAIKEKFKCSNKSNLIVKAIELGCLHIIPI